MGRCEVWTVRYPGATANNGAYVLLPCAPGKLLHGEGIAWVGGQGCLVPMTEEEEAACRLTGSPSYIVAIRRGSDLTGVVHSYEGELVGRKPREEV